MGKTTKSTCVGFSLPISAPLTSGTHVLSAFMKSKESCRVCLWQRCGAPWWVKENSVQKKRRQGHGFKCKDFSICHGSGSHRLVCGLWRGFIILKSCLDKFSWGSNVQIIVSLSCFTSSILLNSNFRFAAYLVFVLSWLGISCQWLPSLTGLCLTSQPSVYLWEFGGTLIHLLCRTRFPFNHK